MPGDADQEKNESRQSAEIQGQRNANIAKQRNAGQDSLENRRRSRNDARGWRWRRGFTRLCGRTGRCSSEQLHPLAQIAHWVRTD